MAKYIVTRPLDKIIFDQTTGRLLQPWDTFLAQASALLNDVQRVGSFTMTATASLVVTDNRVTANSFVQLMPTNAAAAQLQGSAKFLYVSVADIISKTSFEVKTANATSAAGTEEFRYWVIG
jgi:hypothetical protein